MRSGPVKTSRPGPAAWSPKQSRPKPHARLHPLTRFQLPFCSCMTLLQLLLHGPGHVPPCRGHPIPHFSPTCSLQSCPDNSRLHHCPIQTRASPEITHSSLHAWSPQAPLATHAHVTVHSPQPTFWAPEATTDPSYLAILHDCDPPRLHGATTHLHGHHAAYQPTNCCLSPFLWLLFPHLSSPYAYGTSCIFLSSNSHILPPLLTIKARPGTCLRGLVISRVKREIERKY